MHIPTGTAARFWAKVDKSGECWLWSGSLISSGYGNFSWTMNGSRHWMLAHRFVLELTSGAPVPASMEVDHLCRVRRCVQPSHLEIVTPAENRRRSIPFRAAPTRPDTCKRGHEWTEGNYSTDKDGWRTCLICRRAAEAARSPEQRLARTIRRREARAQGRPS